MTSIVTDVLIAAGKLKKESTQSKVNELEIKVRELKVNALGKLGARYQKFLPFQKTTSQLSQDVSKILQDANNLNEDIDKQVKQQLSGTVEELKLLEEKLSEMKLLLDAVKQVVGIHEALEASHTHMGNKEYKDASEELNRALLLCKQKEIKEVGIPLLNAISMEVVIQREQLTYDLDELWRNNIFFEGKGESTKETTLIVQNLEEVKTHIEAMEAFGTLQKRLEDLGKKCLKFIFLPVLRGGSVAIENDPLKITVSDEGGVTEASAVLFNIGSIFKCLHDGFLHYEISDSCKLMRRFGSIIGGEFCELVIRETLASAVPSSSSGLEEFRKLQDDIENFQLYLCSIDFLPEDKSSLVSYARNVDVLFANKMCQEMLTRARDMMYQPLHDSIKIDETPADESFSIPLSKKDTLKPKFLLSNSTLQFPSCQISVSLQSIVQLIEEVMSEVCNSEALCASRLYTTARNIVELYCIVVPVYHKVALETLPQQAAICHNNYMYLSHQLLTLMPRYQSRLPDLLRQQPLSWMDLYQKLRTVGVDVFRQQMQRQKNQLNQICRESGGFKHVASDPSLSTSVERAVKQCVHQLQLLQRVWQPVLPLAVYSKTMGILVNSLVEELICQIVSLEDIPADSALQIISVLSILTSNVPNLFKVDESGAELKILVLNLVKNWGRLEEVVLVLRASMRDIEDRWSNGKGPLALHFSLEDTKHLIRALFRNTDRRAKVLARMTC